MSAAGGPGLECEALLLDEDLSLRVGRRRLDLPRPGQVLVRVAWAGVCGSDLHVLRNGAWVSYWPATLGHEIAGVVAECPGGELARGTPVVADSRVPCGGCAGCARAANLCETLAWVGEAFPGGFATHVLLAADRVVPTPPDLEPAVAALAEPLAVAAHACSRAAADPRRVLVLGYGPIGALVHAELARRWPAALVSVSEPEPSRRLLADAFGAEVLAGPPPQGRFDLVVDAAGAPTSLPGALGATARGGCVLLVALGHHPLSVLPAELAEHSLEVIGCSGFAGELPEAVATLAADPGRFRPLVSDAVLIEEAPARLAALLEAPSAGKVLVGS